MREPAGAPREVAKVTLYETGVVPPGMVAVSGQRAPAPDSVQKAELTSQKTIVPITNNSETNTLHRLTFRQVVS